MQFVDLALPNVVFLQSETGNLLLCPPVKSRLQPGGDVQEDSLSGLALLKDQVVTCSRIDLQLLVPGPHLPQEKVGAGRLAERVVLAVEYEERQAD